ncbi:hypothetical protein OK016_14925 [Vibrio chagasii]|nr:hypothetical protein [Vibrio chagasii]
MTTYVRTSAIFAHAIVAAKLLNITATLIFIALLVGIRCFFGALYDIKNTKYLQVIYWSLCARRNATSTVTWRKVTLNCCTVV